MEQPRLLALRRAPGMGDQANRHVGRAAQQLAFRAQRAAGVAQYFFERLAFTGAELGRGLVPQLGQRAARALVDRATDRAFELQRMAAQSLSLDAAWCHVLEHLVDQAGQRVHDMGSLASFVEQQRKVMAQRAQISVRRKQRGAQAKAGYRGQAHLPAVGLQSAGDVEDHLIGVLDWHVHRELSFGWDGVVAVNCVQAACWVRAGSSGQTVYLSSSRLNPLRMYSGERIWPAWRKSS